MDSGHVHPRGIDEVRAFLPMDSGHVHLRGIDEVRLWPKKRCFHDWIFARPDRLWIWLVLWLHDLVIYSLFAWTRMLIEVLCCFASHVPFWIRTPSVCYWVDKSLMFAAVTFQKDLHKWKTQITPEISWSWLICNTFCFLFKSWLSWLKVPFFGWASINLVQCLTPPVQRRWRWRGGLHRSQGNW